MWNQGPALPMIRQTRSGLIPVRMKTDPELRRIGRFILVGIGAYVVLRIGIAPLPETGQHLHLRQVREHIASISNEWAQVRSTNEGLRYVQFYQETRGDGLFGIRGYVTSEVQVSEAIRFATNTQPPRPIFKEFLKIVEPDRLDFWGSSISEPSDSANASQPIRSETNGTSPAAGSRR